MICIILSLKLIFYVLSMPSFHLSLLLRNSSTPCCQSTEQYFVLMYSYTEIVMVRRIVPVPQQGIKGMLTSYGFKQLCHENILISWRSQTGRRNNFSQHLVEDYYNLVPN